MCALIVGVTARVWAGQTPCYRSIPKTAFQRTVLDTTHTKGYGRPIVRCVDQSRKKWGVFAVIQVTVL